MSVLVFADHDNSKLGDARKDYWAVYLDWFRHWLVDDREPLALPRVQYYLMGENEWRSSSAWPPP